MIYSSTVVPAQAETQYNAALHEPVPWLLELYHMQAGLIMGTALDALDDALAEYLSTGSSCGRMHESEERHQKRSSTPAWASLRR